MGLIALIEAHLLVAENQVAGKLVDQEPRVVDHGLPMLSYSSRGGMVPPCGHGVAQGSRLHPSGARAENDQGKRARRRLEIGSLDGR